MSRTVLTIEQLDNDINSDKILALGYAKDNLEGLHMTGSGKELHWILKIGTAHDWCVYCHWSDKSTQYVLSNGDKVFDRNNINNILDITDEVWARYRD
jgi:hypothetical protein